MSNSRIRLVLYEILGILMVFGSMTFFWFSVKFLSEKDYIAAILQIFIGFALIRGGLEITKIALISRERS